jgi:hypothetical protein
MKRLLGTALLSLMLGVPAAFAAVAGGTVVTTTMLDTDGNGQPDQRSVVTTDFDDKGRVLRKLEQFDNGNDGSFEGRRTTVRRYDKSGNVVREDVSDNTNDLGSGGSGGVFERTVTDYVYDAKGYLVQQNSTFDGNSDSVLESRQKTTYRNDAKGNALQTVIELDLGADGTLESISTATVTYDRAGRPLTVTSEADAFPADGSLDFRVITTSAYDAGGNLVEQTSETDLGADGTIEATSRSATTYNKDGHPLTALNEQDDDADGTPSFRGTGTYTYNADGTLRDEAFEADIAEGAAGADIDGVIDQLASASYEYDGKGNVVRQVSSQQQLPYPAVTETTVSAYDSRGNVVSRNVDIDFNSDGNVDSTTTSGFTYDSAWRLVRSTTDSDFDADGDIDYASVETVVYDGVKR